MFATHADINLRAMYVCRSCGTECASPGTFVRCPVCGIKWS